jgi:hypothetical protein
MLTPMMVQYLVGLCCLRHDPDAVDITVGDMVFDVAAGKGRDVDVTVTIQDKNGVVTAFKAAEVKHEGEALDVGTIEQLCLKLADMPKVTQKSIFSSSGYTAGAKAKARAHSVELYSLKPWDRPIEEDFPDFEGVKTPAEFLAHFESNLLYWVNYRLFVVSPSGPSSFIYKDSTPVLASTGKQHNVFNNMQEFRDEILKRSTGILCTQEPASTILRSFPYGIISEDLDYLGGPSWPHTHTIDVTRDEVYLQAGERGPFMIESVTITGQLQWRKRKREPQFFILEKVSDRTVFAGAAVADYGADDGRMFAMIFPKKGRTLGIHQFQIPEKQRNMIRNLKIKVSSS